ncbi:hypothetical protein KPL71_015153 [Citrus sinensis]|uniref:Uncharacterized protein n=1 Tax=Citrus sinensis TaxID=2711 RepID=A0ACB8KGW7_CITSI|nr:hypothetical protein KPL71_015153 [Citrus sinensis]
MLRLMKLNFECHQQLQNLYNSTEAAKNSIFRGILSVVLKVCCSKLEANGDRKFAEDCCKCGAEIQSDNSCVARAAFQFGTSYHLMENKRETLLRILGDQVFGHGDI